MRPARLAVLALAYLAGGCGLEPQAVYLPIKTITRTPADEKIPFEEVTFAGSDGLTLRGWYMPPPTPGAPVVLDCHGIAGNLSNRVGMFELLRPLGLGVLAFDYRGYGRSQGTPSERGLYRDARSAWDFLTQTRGIDPARIILYGQSLGGPVAAELATRVRPAGLILQSTFTSLTDAVAELIWLLPVRLIYRQAYPTVEYLPQIQCPLLILHSRQDEVVPFHHALDLLKAAHEPKKLVELIGDHNTGLYYSKSFPPAVAAFVGECMAAAR